MRNRRLRRLYLALALSLFIPFVAQMQAVAQTPVVASPPARLTYDQAKFRLDQVMQGLTQLDGQLDRTQFDLDALAAKIGFDAQDAVTFVHDQIAFEQYPGLLRGAQGTLLSRAGNALDQAVLLATLLGKQGFETRIDRATLTPEQAQALVNQMAAPRPPAPAIGDMSQIKATLTQIGQSAGKGDQEIAQLVNQALNPPSVAQTPDYQASQRDADFVLKSLAGAGVKLGDPRVVDDLVKEAQDYFWVEYREDPTSPWTAVHPAFKDPNAAPKNLKPSATFKDPASLPPDVQYRFRFDVTVEQAYKGKLGTTAVLSVPDQTVSDMIGVPISFTNYANGIAKVGSTGDVAKILDQTTLFVPYLNGALDPSALAFDLHGTTYHLNQLKPGEFSASPMPGAAIAGGLAGAAGALGGATATATPTNVGDLTAEWIDYTITLPGGKTETFRRTLLDRLGPANRAANTVPATLPGDDQTTKLALLQHQTIMLDPAAYPMGYLLDRAIARLVTSRPLLDANLKKRYAPAAPVSLPDDLMSKLGSAWPGFPPLFYAFAWGATAAPGVVSYRPSPALAVYREEIAPGGSGTAWHLTNAVDIVSNPRRSFAVAEGKVALAPQAAAGTGVWETHAEDKIPAPPDTTRFNTMTAFQQAAAASIPIQVVKSEGDLAASGVKLPADAMAHLKQDLAAGYAVVVPKTLPAGQTMTGWWRVDPRTGETLGMTSDGRGQATAEYTLLITAVACAAYAGFRGWSVGAFAGNCGGIVGGGVATILGASLLTGIIVAVVFVLIADLAG